MAATETGTFNNFIDGEYVDAAEGAHDRRRQPGRPARRSPRRRSRPPRTSTARSRPPAARSTAGPNTTPGDRAPRCCSSPTRSRSTATSSPSSRPATPASRSRRSRTTRSRAMVDNLRFFAGAARTLEGKAAGEYLEGYTSMIRREPVGVVGQIAPWNYPLMMAIWKIGPALAAGNTIVLKPAQTTPLTTLRLAELAAEFLPKGVLNVVAGGDETGEAIVRHADVDMVSLTGSVESGKWIAARRRGHAQARAPRARRQGAGRRLRRRRHGGRRGDDRRHRLLQRRPGLHGGDARARRLEGLRRRRRRASPSRPPSYKLGDTLRPRDDARAAELRAPARARRGLPRAQAGPRRDRHRRQGARPARLLPRADRRRRPAPGRRDDPARDLRPGHHRPAVHRRGRGDRLGQRHALRPRVVASGRATSAARCASRKALRFGCVWINDHIPLASEMPHGGFKQSGYGKDLSMYALEDYTSVKHVDGVALPSPVVTGAAASASSRRGGACPPAASGATAAVGRVLVRGRGTCSARGEALREPLERELAVARLRARVLRHGGHARAELGRHACLLGVRSARSTRARRTTASIRDAVTFAC